MTKESEIAGIRDEDYFCCIEFRSSNANSHSTLSMSAIVLTSNAPNLSNQRRQ
jgi:hypothetical protein